MRALRHHAARTRSLAEPRTQANQPDGIRAWFQMLFAVLRVRSGARRLALRGLLPRPALLRAAPAQRAPVPHGGANRRPRRLAASSGWFAFGAR